MKTFCIVIGQPLVVPRCPLQPLSCTWQHRESNFCKYTDKELSVQEHAELVGAPSLKSSEILEIEQQLVEKIRSEL